MPNKKRRDHQHIGQEPKRKRAFNAEGDPAEKYKPGFPMNLFLNTKIFVVVGIGIMAGGVVLAAILQPQDSTGSGDLPEATPTVIDDEDPDAEPTPDPRQFDEADEVIDAEAYDYSAVITTEHGDIEIDLFEEVAPNTVNNFVFLAQNGFFDELRWHRVEDGFVAQAGDPLTAVDRDLHDPSRIGQGNPGYSTEEEPNELSNERGTIAMAKASGATEFGSQFFINLDDNTFLDEGGPGDSFYPFAEVVSGMDVVDQLQVDDVIESVEISEEEK